MKLTAIDLFSGCGGFSVGFKNANFSISKAVEYDNSIANIYKINHPNSSLIINDIGNVANKLCFSDGEADVIIGGPPCQGFSMAGSRIRKNSFIDDPRNYLFKQYLKVVQIIKPKVFIIENVKGILSMKHGDIFREIIRVFSDEKNFGGEKYYVHFKKITALDYGIPQKRERIIIIGQRKIDFDFEGRLKKAKSIVSTKYPFFFDKVTIRDAIGNLPNPTEDGIINNPIPKTKYQEFLHCNSNIIENHTKKILKEKTISRIMKIKPGENFRVLNENIKSIHSGSYGRLCWDGVAPTITTRFDTPSGGSFTHPIKNRTITPREAARIQSFPDDFIFRGSNSVICRTIGNAVPPKIAYIFAIMIKEMIKNGC